MSPIFLRDTWCLYFHDPADDNWDFATSYKPLGTIATVEEFIAMQAAFQGMWSKGMFFLSREHIMPIWEDQQHAKGGCLSFKGMKNELQPIWFDMTARLVGETLVSEAGAAAGFSAEHITAVSISPKRSYCIIRIWVSEPEMRSPSYFTVAVPGYSSLLYKPHIAEGDSTEVAVA